MKKFILRAISCVMAILFLLPIISVFAQGEEGFKINGNSLENEYLSLSVRENNGRFTIGTTNGNPEMDSDNGAKLMYGWPGGGTSYTTVVIDGRVHIYGDNGFIQKPTYDMNSGNNISVAKYGDVEVKQILTIVNNNSTDRSDVVEVKYEVTNKSEEAHEVGVRIMFDTMLGGNDSAPFRIPGVGAVDTQMEFTGENIPQYWQAFDSLTDPKVISQGSFLRSAVNKPDKVQFTNWGKVSGTAWNCPVNEGNKNGDSAVTVIWDEKPLAMNEKKEYTTHYGLSELTQDTKPPLAVSLYGDSTISMENGKYTPNPMNITAYIQNIGSGTATNAWIQIFAIGALSVNGKHTERVELGTILPLQEKQQSWNVKIDGVATDTQEMIRIDVGADGVETKSLIKYINIPAVGKDNEILWGKKDKNGKWSGKDNLAFINTYDSFFSLWDQLFNKESMTYHLEDGYLYSLVDGMSPTVISYIANKKDNKWGGSCYGMSCVISLMKDGRLTPSYWQRWAKNTHDLKAPQKSKQVENLVNFYQLMYALPDIQEAHDTNTGATYHPEKLLRQIVDECRKVRNGGLPVVISYAWESNEIKDGEHVGAGHAIVGYDVAEGEYNVNGKTFRYRVSICDPNEDTYTYFYITEDFNDWCYDGLATTAGDNDSVWVKDGKEQKWITNVFSEINMIDLVNPETEMNRTRLKNYNRNFISKYLPGACVVRDANGNTIDLMKIYASDGSSTAFLPDGSKFTVEPVNGNQTLDTSIVLKDCSMTVNANKAGKAVISEDGKVSFSGNGSSCELELTLNSAIGTLPWHTVTLQGEQIDDYSMQPTTNGVIVSGSNLTNTTITVNNLEETLTADISTTKDSALVGKTQDGNMAVYTDEDNDGVYENKIAEGKKETEAPDNGNRLIDFVKSMFNFLKSIVVYIINLIKQIIGF